MKYLLIATLLISQMIYSAPAMAIGETKSIQDFVTGYKNLTISGITFSTDRLRKFYASRNFVAVWHDSAGPRPHLKKYLEFAGSYRFNGGNKELLREVRNVIAKNRADYWITIEMLTTESLLRYLYENGVAGVSNLNIALNGSLEDFDFYIANLRLRSNSRPVLKAEPVDPTPTTQEPILRARPVIEIKDVVMPAAPLGSSASRFPNDPTRDDSLAFNEQLPQAVFVDSSGRPNALAAALRTALRGANRHGLNPDDYWSLAMERVYTNTVNGQQGTNFENYARYALLRYVNHLYGGRLNPELIDAGNFQFKKRGLTDYSTLIAVLRAAPSTLALSLDNYAPQIPQYKQLMRNLALIQTMKVQNVWRTFPQPKSSLKMGEANPMIPGIRIQLAYLGYQNTGDSDMYDESFALLLKSYLSGNGIPGPVDEKSKGYNATLQIPVKLDYRFWTSMSKSVDDRIMQVVINLEKLRWVPRVNKPRFAFINLAAQELNLIDSGVSIMKFRTIIGRAERSTPSMLQQSKRLILNPTWTAPLKIAAMDKVPLIRENPSYLTEHNMYVLQSRNKEYLDYSFLTNPGMPEPQRGILIDKFFQNFSRADQALKEQILAMPRAQQYKPLLEKFLSGISQDPAQNKFYIVQAPGNLNALGVVKFPLQDLNGNSNSDDIYLHDTNERNLFENAVRYNSSGCIRLQFPLEFAAELLKGKGWTIDDIKAKVPWNDPLAKVPFEATEDVKFDTPLLIHIMYMTSDQTDEGGVRMFEDTYGLDAKVVDALRASN